jgi:hypothetical protein
MKMAFFKANFVNKPIEASNFCHMAEPNWQSESDQAIETMLPVNVNHPPSSGRTDPSFGAA